MVEQNIVVVGIDLSMDLGMVINNKIENVKTTDSPLMVRSDRLSSGERNNEASVSSIEKNDETAMYTSDEAAKPTEDKKQLTDAKAWIQNSLMTVVGFGVLAYLQTLEGSA